MRRYKCLGKTPKSGKYSRKFFGNQRNPHVKLTCGKFFLAVKLTLKKEKKKKTLSFFSTLFYNKPLSSTECSVGGTSDPSFLCPCNDGRCKPSAGKTETSFTSFILFHTPDFQVHALPCIYLETEIHSRYLL